MDLGAGLLPVRHHGISERRVDVANRGRRYQKGDCFVSIKYMLQVVIVSRIVYSKSYRYVVIASGLVDRYRPSSPGRL